jgi:hypothetical protein
MSVYCECCVLSGRGLCDELITRSEESYRLWCVVMCDLETSWMRRPWPTGGFCVTDKKISNWFATLARLRDSLMVFEQQKFFLHWCIHVATDRVRMSLEIKSTLAFNIRRRVMILLRWPRNHSKILVSYSVMRLPLAVNYCPSAKFQKRFHSSWFIY